MRVYLATPCYSPIDPRIAHAVAMDIVPKLVASGHEVRWDIEAFDPNQVRARSVIAERFMRSEFDRSLWFDHDTLATGEDVVALLAVDEPVVGTCCPPRESGKGFVGMPVEPKTSRGVLLEMERIGFGMVSVSRAAMAQLSEAAPRTIVAQRGASEGRRVPMVFETAVHNERFVSCDYEFSRRWRSLGGKLWLHTGVHVGHVGSHVYRE